MLIVSEGNHVAHLVLIKQAGSETENKVIPLHYLLSGVGEVSVKYQGRLELSTALLIFKVSLPKVDS